MQRRSLRVTRALAIGLALTFAATACGGGDSSDKSDDTKKQTEEIDPGTPVPGGELSYAIEADAGAGYCLPNAQLTAGGIQVSNAIYDSLFVFNDKFEAVPYLAETSKWNADYTELTLTLRDGVKFHDGTPLDAETVKLNLDVTRGEPNAVKSTGVAPELFIFVFQDIKEVTAPDAKTVVISTKRPWPALPQFLASGRNGIVAKAQLADGLDKCKENLIGTGPFKLIDWKPNVKMQLEKNPDYWRKDKAGKQLPYLDKLNFVPIEGGPDRFNALEGNSVQAMHVSTQSIFDQISDDDRFRLIQETEGHKEIGYGLVNLSKAPLDDFETRKNLSMAIDRETLNDINSGGKFKVADQPFDTDVIGYLEDIPTFEYDPDAAAEFFDGKNIKLNLSYAVDPTTKKIADEVKAELEDVGVEVNVDDVDQATLIKRAVAGEYDIILFRNHPGADPDTQYYWWYSTSLVNFGRINDPEIDRLLDEGRVEPDQAKRKAIYEDLNRAFAKGGYAQWNWYTEWAIGSYDNVHNLTGATLPDGSKGPGMNWGWHSLAEAWVSE